MFRWSRATSKARSRPCLRMPNGRGVPGLSCASESQSVSRARPTTVLAGKPLLKHLRNPSALLVDQHLPIRISPVEQLQVFSPSMAVSESYRAFVLEQLGRVTPVTAKSMFGGVGIYAQGSFFALIAEDRLYFKVDDRTRPDFERLGMEPFRPFGD